jgi:hypothetical protein
MTKTQKVFLVIYLVLAAFACIYVPWKVNTAVAQGTIVTDSIMYSPIWAMHTFADTYAGAYVDLSRVLLEIVALTAVFAIPFVLAAKTPEDLLDEILSDTDLDEEGSEEEPKEEEPTDEEAKVS